MLALDFDKYKNANLANYFREYLERILFLNNN